MALTRTQFDRIMAAHEPRLRAQVLAQVRDAGLDVDELVQEVRIRLWRRLGAEPADSAAARGENNITQLSSYLRQMVVSVVVDALRQRQARREDTLQTLDGSGAGVSERSPERDADRAQRLVRIRTAVAALPQRRREPAQLLLLGFNVQEIARMLGLTDATARNLAYRGVEEIGAVLRAAGLGDWE